MPSFEDAVTEIFQQRFRSVVRYVHRLTGEPDTAQDVAQEAFVRLYQRGEMPDDPAAWIMTVATNLVRDVQRTEQRRHALLTEYAQDGAPSHPERADEAVVVNETRDRVRQALDSLSARDQQLLLLRHEGYSYRELARIIGVSENSVGTLLIRATQAFQRALTRPLHADHSTLD